MSKLISHRRRSSVLPLWPVLLLLCMQSLGAQTAHQAFEIATVKAAPNADPSTGMWSPPGTGQFSATHIPLALLLQLAYGIDKGQIANKPPWLGTNLYDVNAKPEQGVALSREELQPRLQDLLQQRFHLRAHMETRPARGYSLFVAKGGPQLVPTKGDHFPGFRTNVSPGYMQGFNWSMPVLARYISAATGFPVVDQTGLTGSFDISFTYAIDTNPESTGMPLAAALKQATSLLLKPEKVPVKTLVIDSVNPVPTAN